MWIVSVNAPGYMPEQEPIECETWEEAAQELRSEIRYTLSALDPEGVHTTGDEWLCEDALDDKPYSTQVLGLVHSIERND